MERFQSTAGRSSTGVEPRFAIPTENIKLAIFDLDGVVTQTSKTHARAWKEMLDEVLAIDAEEKKKPFVPFDIEKDYELYISGIPRMEGLTRFLKYRSVDLPLGNPHDAPGARTLYGLGNRKNELYLNLLAHDGVEVYPATVERIREFRARGIKTAVISSSRNCVDVLETVDLLDLFDAKVDGNDAEQLNLKGKPKPDIFLQAARELSISPKEAMVFEDAIFGVEAGKAGGFRFVVGLNRTSIRRELQEAGADLVVDDLAETYLA